MRNLIAIMLAASFGLGSCVCEGVPPLVMEFDGSTQYVSQESAVISTTPFTMSAWVKTTTTTAAALFIGDKDADDRYHILYVTSGGYAAINSRYQAPGSEAVSTTIINDDGWHFVAAVLDSATSRKIYVDGVLEDTDTDPVDVQNIDMVNIGRMGDLSPALYFSGDIFLPRNHTRALSAAEIRGLYKQYGRNDLGDVPVVFPRKHDPSLVGVWTAPVLAADRNTGTVTTNDTPFIDASFERNFGSAQGGVTIGGYTIATPQNIPFTVLAQDTDDLDMVAATLTDADFAWREVATGTTTNGKTFDMGVAALGKHFVTVTGWSAVTSVNWADASVSVDIEDFGIATRLSNLQLQRNPSVFGDVSAAQLSVPMLSLFVDGTSATYDDAGGYLNSVRNAFSFRMQDCALPQSNVDNILVDLDTSGATGGSCNVGGSNAAPSATGLASKTSLEGKGWTVTITAP